MRQEPVNRPDQILVIGLQGSATEQIRAGIRRFAEQHDLRWQVRIMTPEDWKKALGGGFFDDVPVCGVVGTERANIRDWCRSRSVPMAVWGHDPRPAPGYAAIGIDADGIAAVAVSHLRDSGYTSAVVVEGDGQLPVRDVRHEAFIQAALQSDLDVRRLPKERSGDPHGAAAAERAIADLLAGTPVPSAVFCYQDREAVWLAQLCERFGLPVPGRIGILGVDGTEICTRGLTPLSSVRIPWATIGGAAGLAIRRMMDDPAAVPEPTVVRPMGVQRRESTALAFAGSPEIGKALRLLRDGLAKGISVTGVADKVGLPLRTFQRRFRDEVGVGAKRWLQEQRLQRAEELLMATDLEIGRIACRCGFSTHAHFTKTYREWAGHTPQELRTGCAGR